jgi:hypothetical protein
MLIALTAALLALAGTVDLRRAVTAPGIVGLVLREVVATEFVLAALVLVVPPWPMVPAALAFTLAAQAGLALGERRQAGGVARLPRLGFHQDFEG